MSTSKMVVFPSGFPLNPPKRSTLNKDRPKSTEQLAAETQVLGSFAPGRLRPADWQLRLRGPA